MIPRLRNPSRLRDFRGETPTIELPPEPPVLIREETSIPPTPSEPPILIPETPPAIEESSETPAERLRKSFKND